MKTLLVPLALFAAAQLASADGILPNPSFETTTANRPKGWRVFLSPDTAKGEFFLQSGQEGTDTHTGAAALLFSFPEETDVAQAMWMADPTYGGGEATPGRYVGTFWTRAENLPPGFHLWVSVVGYGANGQRISEAGRSEYLTAKQLEGDTWTQIRFSFDVPSDSGITRLAPSVVLKAQPSGAAAPAPTDLRVWVDDLQITRE
jgi:hypothetical protein